MTPPRAADPSAATDARPQARRRAPKLALIVIGVAALAAVLAAGATYFLTADAGADAAQPPATPAPAEKHSEVVELDTFTVNLQGKADRVLYIGLGLKVADDATAKRVVKHKAELRSRLLTALSDQDAQTLKTSKGKQQLAETLRATARQPFVENAAPLAIRTVLFSHFVIH